MTVTSGRKWLELSRNCGPLGLLEKMLLESSIWHSTQCYLTWKARDTPHGHFLYQLVASMPHTRDTEQQLWPAPKATIRGDCPSERKRRTPDLAAVKMFPTPTAQDARNSTFPESQIQRDSLVGELMRERYATPLARDYRTGQASRWKDTKHGSRNLNDQIAMYPIPTCGSLCGGKYTQEYVKKLEKEKIISAEKSQSMQVKNGGQLNPTWVEWLMGFPIGWTELRVSETL